MSNNKPVELAGSKNEKLICAIFFVLAVIVAVFLRFYQLDIKPFHHDEGVNSYFLLNLAERGQYKYDPTNYHGPTLYYFAYLALLAFGETDFALRFTPALFGVLTVLLVWPLRQHLGTIGAPVAALLIALSPGLVYFSRDFIHEMSFGCFSLGIVACAWRYAQTKSFRWLALMSFSAGLFFATKETAIITVFVLIIAIICATAWVITRKLVRERQFTPAAFIQELKRDFLSALPSLDQALAAIIIFVFVNILFYNSFFTPQPNPDGGRSIHWRGVMDAVESVALWTRRSGSEHVKSFWYYFGILFKLELPLLVGSLLAGIFVVWRSSRFWLFVAAWALGLTLAYSIIGYKTPWLMISFLIPMALLAGYAAEQIYRALPGMALKLLLAVVITTVLILSGVLAWKVNFRKHDDNSNTSGYFTRAGEKLQLKAYTDGLHGYVYAQTDRDFLNLVQAIKDEASKLPSRNRTGIYVASPDYWPLPWYLRDYDHVAYSGNLPVEPQQISQPIIVASAGQRSELDGLPGWRALPQSFTLRPSVELVIYVRDESLQQ
jgi:uncharacterized protein (TIGR03663 family)